VGVVQLFTIIRPVDNAIKIMAGVRLAFKCGVWQPSAAEWVLAMSSVQPEERLRIRQFVFRKHTRSALVSCVGLVLFSVLADGKQV